MDHAEREATSESPTCGRRLAGACAAALIGGTLAVANLGGSSDPTLDAAPTWSARPHVASGASQPVAGPGRRSRPRATEGRRRHVEGRPEGRGRWHESRDGHAGRDPVDRAGNSRFEPRDESAMRLTSLPNSVPSGGTADGNTADGGTTDGARIRRWRRRAMTTGDGTGDGATSDAPELNRLAPSIGSGETSADLGVVGAPACGGPSVLDVGEVGVFTAPDRSAEPFAWEPKAPGAFDVVLDGPAGVVCSSEVTVVAVDLDAGATGDLTPP